MLTKNPMIFRFLPLTVCLCVSAVAQDAAPSESDFLAPYRAEAMERWENEIVKLEAKDEVDEDPADAILFIGSSSIRRWDDIAVDMAPYRTIQRGYGGAKFSDVAVYAERLIHPHQYRGLVIFVGNDVSGKPTDHTPDQVEQLVRHIVGVSHAHSPGSPVLLIEVTPTESRWRVWAKIREVNARLREIALSTPDTYFIPTASHYLLPDGTPRAEFFVQDKLHLSERGYDVWAGLIRRRLDDVFRSMAETEAAAEVVSTETVGNEN